MGRCSTNQSRRMVDSRERRAWRGVVAHSLLAAALWACDRDPATDTAQAAQAAPLTSVAPADQPAAVEPPPTEAVQRDCNAICQRSIELRCEHAEECLPNCVAAASATPCKHEFASFYGCLVTQPLENWHCEEDGVAAIREGHCEREQERALQCMDQRM
jgi:hypothetical protein